jgi:hypothetical protein
MRYRRRSDCHGMVSRWGRTEDWPGGCRLIELHERLSEFSYGYGVTREVERLLLSLGIRTVPFQPSLLQEKQVGFDAAFDKAGVPLLLQFKLGQSLSRFVRSDTSLPAPYLSRPFFRFTVDTLERDGQFETLLKAEADGAEVYYVAPRFADWPHYVQFYEEEGVLENSVLVRPGEIRAALDSKGAPDGRHRVVYDGARVHVCSKPVAIEEVRPALLAERVAVRVRKKKGTLGEDIERLYAGLEDRGAIRREQPGSASHPDLGGDYLETAAPELDRRQPPALTHRQRLYRLTQLRERSKSEEDAVTAALGLELWGLGIQLLLAVDETGGTGAP